PPASVPGTLGGAGDGPTAWARAAPSRLKWRLRPRSRSRPPPIPRSASSRLRTPMRIMRVSFPKRVADRAVGRVSRGQGPLAGLLEPDQAVAACEVHDA